jgi:tRNA-dihydrouridine synthase C
MLHPSTPAVILAPMEGVTDAPMRAVQGATGAFTFAVSEFLRVTQVIPPKHVFLRHVPELCTAARTQTGLPVQIQLLGGDAERMAEAAVYAHELGATAIDINFGCPARTVNRHDGGAALLRHPKRIRAIVSSIRAALPREVPVSAKLRLGWDCVDAIHENAEMAAEGGASWLTIHARTRVAGYSPPVHWKLIGQVRERLKLPVVANGDIWTIEDFRQCREETGSRHFMLGRGALANPRLPQLVASELGLVAASANPELAAFEWTSELRKLVEWSAQFETSRGEQVVHKLKQWLNLAAKFGAFGGFDTIKRARTVEELFAKLVAN